MMVVEYPVPSEDSVIAGHNDPEAFVWQHGLTPPLHYVRQRRWRKRKIGDKVRELQESDIRHRD
jgi:transcription initiation factor TFIID subunit 7